MAKRKRNNDLAVAMRGTRAEAEAIVEIVRALRRVPWDGGRARVVTYALRVVDLGVEELQGSVERPYKVPPHTHAELHTHRPQQ